MNDVLEPRGERLRAALRLAGGRGLALDRQAGGEYVGWAVFATADLDDGEPERLRDVTVAEAVDLAPEERELIVTATLDAIAVLRLSDGTADPAGEVVPPQSERMVDELVEAGLPRDTVLNLADRLSRAHQVARDLRSHPAREAPTSDKDRTLELERVGARLRRDLERPNLSAGGPAAAAALVSVAVVGLLVLVSTRGAQPVRHTASTQPSSSVSAPTRRPPARHPSAAQRKPSPIVTLSLSATGAWDPYGDGREHDTKASAAEDGDSGTYWPTETYWDGLAKPGVGLLLDAGRALQIRRLVVTTDTPGYTALIEAGAASTGPFRPISQARTVDTMTAFSLRARAERYYLIWITRLDHRAHVNEVRAFGY